MSTLVVFSHLRWDFVFQRPQQLMTRFAQHDRVIFIEEPVFDPGPAWVETLDPSVNIRILKPHTPLTTRGFEGDQLPVLADVLSAALLAENIEDYCAWFYTPMALPLLNILKPRAVIYDCMDELSAFNGAPLPLRQREHALLKVADLVFTGGPSLYESKRLQHSRVHCFPSAVDVEHFAQGKDTANAHPDLASLGRPRLGFYGVIDERLDIALLDEVAQARPHWHFCLVGPVVKIDATQLPQRENIHYYGQRAYAELPAFLAGWDVCLMPFALNEATRFISPTKTLEYMASEHPVVSTPIADVLLLYGDLVDIAQTPAEFITACERALSETPTAAQDRQLAMRERVAGLSWNATVKAMAALIGETVARNAASAPVPSFLATAAARQAEPVSSAL